MAVAKSVRDKDACMDLNILDAIGIKKITVNTYSLDRQPWLQDCSSAMPNNCCEIIK